MSRRRFQTPPDAARTIAALLALRDQVIAPILAGVRSARLGRKPAHWTIIDRDYETLRTGMQTLFHDLGINASAAAAWTTFCRSEKCKFLSRGSRTCWSCPAWSGSPRCAPQRSWRWPETAGRCICRHAAGVSELPESCAGRPGRPLDVSGGGLPRGRAAGRGRAHQDYSDPARARLSSGVSASVSAPQKSMATGTLTGNAPTGGG